MYSLIVTIISIALFSIAISAGINYIDTDRVIAKNKAMTVDRNIVSVGLAMTTFKNLVGSEAEDINRIIPSFTTLSFSSNNIQLEEIGVSDYNGTNNVRFSCFLIQNATESDRLMYDKINSHKQEDGFLLVNDCSDSSDTDTMTNSTSTFRMKNYYL